MSPLRQFTTGVALLGLAAGLWLVAYTVVLGVLTALFTRVFP